MSLNFTTRSPNHTRFPVIYVTQLYNQITQPFKLPSHVCHSTLQPGQPTIHAAQSFMSLNFTTRSLNHSRCPVMYVTKLYNQFTQSFKLPSFLCGFFACVFYVFWLGFLCPFFIFFICLMVYFLNLIFNYEFSYVYTCFE